LTNYYVTHKPPTDQLATQKWAVREPQLEGNTDITTPSVRAKPNEAYRKTEMTDAYFRYINVHVLQSN